MADIGQDKGVTTSSAPPAVDRPDAGPTTVTEIDDRPNLVGQDPKAVFTMLFDTHARALRGYLAGRVGEHVADDLVAETFLTAFRRREDYDPQQAPIRGWLYGIATNVLRNHRRTEVRRFRAMAWAVVREVDESGEPHDSRVAAKVDAQARMRQLAGALISELSEEERDVLLLSAWAGLEPREIAVALGIPASTVRSRLQRARQKLRQREGSRETKQDREGGNA